MKWTADLIIAVILLAGCFALLFTGIDGEVKTILVMAGGWCFGRAYSQRTGGKEK